MVFYILSLVLYERCSTVSRNITFLEAVNLLESLHLSTFSKFRYSPEAYAPLLNFRVKSDFFVIWGSLYAKKSIAMSAEFLDPNNLLGHFTHFISFHSPTFHPLQSSSSRASAT